MIDCVAFLSATGQVGETLNINWKCEEQHENFSFERRASPLEISSNARSQHLNSAPTFEQTHLRSGSSFRKLRRSLAARGILNSSVPPRFIGESEPLKRQKHRCSVAKMSSKISPPLAIPSTREVSATGGGRRCSTQPQTGEPQPGTAVLKHSVLRYSVLVVPLTFGEMLSSGVRDAGHCRVHRRRQHRQSLSQRTMPVETIAFSTRQSLTDAHLGEALPNTCVPLNTEAAISKNSGGYREKQQPKINVHI